MGNWRKSPPASSQPQPLRIGKTVRTPIVTTSLLKQLAILGAVLAVVAYIIWQVMLLAGSPELHLEFPAEDQVVYSRQLEIIGQTSPGSDVFVDGQPAITTDDGHFRFPVTVSAGVYSFEIEARSSLGRTTTLERTIVVESAD